MSTTKDQKGIMSSRPQTANSYQKGVLSSRPQTGISNPTKFTKMKSEASIIKNINLDEIDLKDHK